jgi:hypothetical protein
MNNYWWVNHKKTFKQETQEGYLWSPKKESDGRNSEFYNNMRKAKPGDRVISYADTKIKCIGTVTDHASHSPKPKSFGNSGDYWSNEGWLVPVSWKFLLKPIKPKNFIEQINPLLPKKYSPLSHKTGNGNQKAYLSKISEKLFNLIIKRSKFNTELETKSFSNDDLIIKIENSIEDSIKNDSSLDQTEKDRIIKARIGQGKFRKDLFKIYPICIVSGITKPKLLIASHIKPWRACETNDERLDKYNGLLLSPHIDCLFDKGFISFKGDGKILISSILTNEEIEVFNLKNRVLEAKPFRNEQKSYLEYHRNNVFLN